MEKSSAKNSDGRLDRFKELLQVVETASDATQEEVDGLRLAVALECVAAGVARRWERLEVSA